MDICTVAFFGHRNITNFEQAERLIEKQVEKLIEEKEYVDFLVGRNGDFDILVASSIKRTRERIYSKNSSLILILPYKTAEYLNNQADFESFYDYVEIFDNDVFPKKAIQARNKEMVDRAEIVICYVERADGGAFQTMNYAKKRGKTVINLYEAQDL